MQLEKLTREVPKSYNFDLDLSNVITDVESGLSYVCAMCYRWRDARKQGRKVCSAKDGVNSCFGPIYGGTFDRYVGPLDFLDWKTFCFVCGEKSDYVVKFYGNDKGIGICKKHFVFTLKQLVNNGFSNFKFYKINS
jgi:hypothetical protein